MVRIVVFFSLCCIAMCGQSYAQEVMIGREGGAKPAAMPPKNIEPAKKAEPIKKAEAVKVEVSSNLPSGNFPKAQPVHLVKPQPVTDRVVKQSSPIVQIVTEEPARRSAVAQPVIAQSTKAPPREKPTVTTTQPPVPPVRKPEPGALVETKPATTGGTSKLLWPKKEAEKTQIAKAAPKESPSAAEVQKLATPPAAIAQSVKSSPTKTAAAPIVAAPTKPDTHPREPSAAPPVAVVAAKKSEPAISLPPKARSESTNAAFALSQPPPRLQTNEAATQRVTFRGDTAFTRLADGFDFPIGKPDAQGYYKARGFRSSGHLGEDWDGIRGGDTDLGDPIYCIGDGVVVFARDCHMGWGNVIIVRHSYRENGTVKNIDSLYGHLNNMLVRRGQAVARGQKIATMGNAHGLYDAHLHLEIRKNLEIGMSRAAFARDFSNYYDPTQFINAHRHLPSSSGSYRVAMNTFTRDAKINFDKARNYSHSRSGGGTGESTAALKKAVAAQASR
jgi:murein DD-endopeptidase MepM/ murein hydrolase activator NlpD